MQLHGEGLARAAHDVFLLPQDQDGRGASLIDGDGFGQAVSAQGNGGLAGLGVRILFGVEGKGEVFQRFRGSVGGLQPVRARLYLIRHRHIGLQREGEIVARGVQLHFVRSEQQGVLLLLADGEGSALAGAGQDDGGVALVVGIVGLGGDGQGDVSRRAAGRLHAHPVQGAGDGRGFRRPVRRGGEGDGGAAALLRDDGGGVLGVGDDDGGLVGFGTGRGTLFLFVVATGSQEQAAESQPGGQQLADCPTIKLS